MKKIHCLNPISKLGTDLLKESYEMTDRLEEAEGILVRSAAMHELDLPDGLLAVARAGAGVNNIPLEKCASRGIVVFNTPGANANGVKEIVLAGMLLGAVILWAESTGAVRRRKMKIFPRIWRRQRRSLPVMKFVERSWALLAWVPSGLK